MFEHKQLLPHNSVTELSSFWMLAVPSAGRGREGGGVGAGAGVGVTGGQGEQATSCTESCSHHILKCCCMIGTF